MWAVIVIAVVLCAVPVVAGMIYETRRQQHQ